MEIDIKKFESITVLKYGSHLPNEGMCIMEAVAYVAGEEHSDAPECVCPTLTTFLRTWNDGLPTDEERTRLLRPLIPKLINTRGDKKLELRRAAMAADWLIRVYTPTWLRLAKLDKQADVLASLPEIANFEQYPSLMPALSSVRYDATAARDAAWNAAYATALDAAWATAWATARATAWDAARAAARAAALDAAVNAAMDIALDAAWDAAVDIALDAARAGAVDAAMDIAVDAARATAWDAARDAARDAAVNAATDAARDAAKPTQKILQQSALELVERMIDAKNSPNS